MYLVLETWFMMGNLTFSSNSCSHCSENLKVYWNCFPATICWPNNIFGLLEVNMISHEDTKRGIGRGPWLPSLNLKKPRVSKIFRLIKRIASNYTSLVEISMTIHQKGSTCWSRINECWPDLSVACGPHSHGLSGGTACCSYHYTRHRKT